MATIHELRRRLKRGPKLSRQARCEFALDASNLPPRKIRPEILSKLRPEIERLAKIDRPGIQAFVRRMRARYPELTA
jgi:hypothetical protein